MCFHFSLDLLGNMPTFRKHHARCSSVWDTNQNLQYGKAPKRALDRIIYESTEMGCPAALPTNCTKLRVRSVCLLCGKAASPLSLDRKSQTFEP